MGPSLGHHAACVLYLGVWQLQRGWLINPLYKALYKARNRIQTPTESDSLIHVDDALRADPGGRFGMVLTNPPFGRSSSEVCESDDFCTTTRNKQLNFVQHVVGLLTISGTAACGGARQRTV